MEVSKLKNKILEIQNVLEDLNRRMEITEERVIELENRSIRTIRLKGERRGGGRRGETVRRDYTKQEQSFRNLSDNFKRSVLVVGVPEGEEIENGSGQNIYRNNA